jgi:general secretion pathway protein E
LSSCVVGVLAQRLVRRICPECKEAYEPSQRELQSLGLHADSILDHQLYRGKGCSYCYGSGFKGRHGIYELMAVNHAITKQIVQSPDGIEMRKTALANGMISLLSHGAELVKNGISTVAEVLRVARGIEEGA